MKVTESESIVTLSSADGLVILRQRGEQITYDRTVFRELIIKDDFGMRPIPQLDAMARERIKALVTFPSELGSIIAEYVGGVDGVKGVRGIAEDMRELTSRKEKLTGLFKKQQGSQCAIL